MIVAHMSDLHLGFNAYRKTAPSGINAREVDVARAFDWIIDDVARIGPELVVVPGDVFDTPRPSPNVLIHAVDRFRRLTEIAPVVVVGGNHDQPRRASDGHPLRLLKKAVDRDRLSVVVEEAALVRGDGWVVVALPEGAVDVGRFVRQADVAAARKEARVSICAIHAPIEDRRGEILYARLGGEGVPVDVLKPESWTLVCAGDYHEVAELAPNAWYSGSIERMNAGPWSEADSPKGYLIHDTEAGTVEHRETPTRPCYDLEPIDCAGLYGDELTAMMLAALEPIEDGAIVRQVLENAPAELVRTIGREAMEDPKERLLHWLVRAKRPEVVRGSVDTPSSSASLRERVERFVADDWTPKLPVDRDEVKREAVSSLEGGAS